MQARTRVALPRPTFLQLPQLQSPKIPTSFATNSLLPYAYDQDIGATPLYGVKDTVDHVTDWRAMEKFVTSQLSNNQELKQSNYSHGAIFQVSPNSGSAAIVSECDCKDMAPEFALASPSSCQVDMWK